MGHVKLFGNAVFHDENTVRVHDRMQSMSHCQHGAVTELIANGGLDEGVGAVKINVWLVRGLKPARGGLRLSRGF